MVSIPNERSGAGIHIFTLGVIKLRRWQKRRRARLFTQQCIIPIRTINPSDIKGRLFSLWFQKCKTPFQHGDSVFLKHLSGGRRIKHECTLHPALR